jgi:hypothetical protein
MRTKIRRYILVVIIAIFNLNMAFADTPSPNPPPPTPAGPPGPPFPIDSNLFILAFAALLLGFYIFNKQKQIIRK